LNNENNSQKISVIIPAYNENLAVGKVVNEVRSILQKERIESEIIVVDDCSTDNTAEEARNAGAKVISHVKQKGVGEARNTGLRNASSNWVLMIDADDSYPPEDIKNLLAYMGKYDMIIGSRKKEQGSHIFLRRPIKWIIKSIAEYISRETIPDLNSGLRIFKKDIAYRFRGILPKGHSWVSTITLAFLCNSYDVRFVPIDYRRRQGKSTFHPVKDTASYIGLVFRTVMYFNPLRFFLPISLVMLLGGTVRTVYHAKFSKSKILESDIIILFVAILIGTLGLLADLIVKQTNSQYKE
jgi:glycosyltransferase involved in cell wall biosynthesis